MKPLLLDVGSTVMINLVSGDAIKGTISFRNAGAVFLKSALLHSGQNSGGLDGEVRIPATSVAWVQVL